jgi:hypothetical protein
MDVTLMSLSHPSLYYTPLCHVLHSVIIPLCERYDIFLKMETVISSTITNQATLCHNSKARNMKLHVHENLKYHIYLVSLTHVCAGIAQSV